MHYLLYLRISSLPLKPSSSAVSEWTSELKIALSLSFSALRLHKRAAGSGGGEGGHFRSKRLKPASDPQQLPVAVGEDRTHIYAAQCRNPFNVYPLVQHSNLHVFWKRMSISLSFHVLSFLPSSYFYFPPSWVHKSVRYMHRAKKVTQTKSRESSTTNPIGYYKNIPTRNSLVEIVLI